MFKTSLLKKKLNTEEGLDYPLGMDAYEMISSDTINNRGHKENSPIKTWSLKFGYRYQKKGETITMRIPFEFAIRHAL